MRIVRTLAALVTGIGVSVTTLPAFAQAYPSKPVRVVVPATPGSTTDIIARSVGQKLSEIWSQPVVVENRAGGGGTIGAGQVARSPADGYTLLVFSSGHAVIPGLYANLSYDPLKDFVDVAPLASQPFVLVAGPSTGVKTVAELIAAARAKPGQIHFGSVGIGTGTHFAAEKFRLAASIDVAHVPYKGGPEVNTDTMMGRVAFWFPPIAIAVPHVQSGKLLALGVSSRGRSSLLPEVPTIAEAGVSGFDDTFWNGLWAPAGTPAAVVEKLSKDVARALATPDLRERLAKLGAEPMNMTPAEFARFVRSEIEESTRIIKAAGIKPQ
jgi:tripartite-type tricarboxylate transporter receptor subunit TctC